MRAMIVGLVLQATSAIADPPRAFLDTGFGTAVGGLQLAVTVDAGGATATFRLKNVGAKAVTFVDEYSCSGRSAWSISMGASETALDRHYGFEPEAHGLTTQQKTVCTRNVPTKRRSVGKGATLAIDVPFATPGEIAGEKAKVFQANAVLAIDTRTDELVLHSAAQTR